MVEEITDKKTAEKAVRASEERLRLAQHVAPIGSFERHVRTGVVTWSTARAKRNDQKSDS